MSDGSSLVRLVEIMQRLLSPEGCPWDREQSFETLRPYVIEEAFEVVDAIDGGSHPALREELGDLLFQVVFLSELGRSEGSFDIGGVIEGISDKMVRRHPHVFADASVGDAQEVLRRWEEIKQEEKQGRGTFEGIPKAMPALSRAVRVGEKAARLGLDWPDAEGVRDKVSEELEELDSAPDPAAEERELGDLLFALASWARHRRIDPEAALRGALTRFEDRVALVERGAAEDGVELVKASADEIDRRWRAAKAHSR